MGTKRKPKPRLGRPPLPPGERKMPLHVLLDPALLADLHELAEAREESMATIVARGLRREFAAIAARDFAPSESDPDCPKCGNIVPVADVRRHAKGCR